MTDGNTSEITMARTPDGSTAIKGPRGAWIHLNGRAEDVMRLQLGGHLVGEMMARALAAMDQILVPDANFSVVVDAESQSGYEPDVRALATAWLLKHNKRLNPAHLLTRTPMIKMGAQMINNALGWSVFKIYEDRGEFERGVAKIVRDSERMRAGRRVP